MQVQTTIEHALWTLTSDTDDPQGGLSPQRALVGSLTAHWAIDVIPPVAQPSTVRFQVYDDGTNPSGWIPLDVGDPISCYVATAGQEGPLTFQGRVSEVSGANHPDGGVVFAVVATDRLGDLTASPAPSLVKGRNPGTSGVPASHALFSAYAKIARWADIALDYLSGSGTPDWDYTRPVQMDASALDAINLYAAHDVRDGVHHYVTFDVDVADPTPITGPVQFALTPYDPAGVDDLAGVLMLDYAGGQWGLIVNPDYYDTHTGVVLEASQLARDVGDWRKGRDGLINTVELTGLFDATEAFPRQVGVFTGGSTVAGVNVSPNVDPLPTGISDGDWAWCVISAATGSGSDPITPPEGWLQYPIEPLQQSSTVRSWLFVAELTSADSGTTPVWVLNGAGQNWVLTGAVVTDTDGIDDYTPKMPATDLQPVPSSASTALSFPSVTPGGKRRLAYAIAALRAGAGATINLPPNVNGWSVEDSHQCVAAASRMGHYAIRKPLSSANPTGIPTGTLSASGVNNGVAWAFTFRPAGTTDQVRAQWEDLVDAYGRNARSLQSFLYYRDDAETLAEQLLGERDQVQLGYGVTALTIAWETLTSDQLNAWGERLWPAADVDALGLPVAITGIPDDWRLVAGPAVFGRLMGVDLTIAGETVRAGLTLRALPPTTGGGITWDEIGALSPDVTPDNLDPTITIDDFSLVEG